MGRINFGWFAVWVLSPDWLTRKMEACDFFRRLGETAAPEGRATVPGLCFVYRGICLTTEENHGKTCQGNQKVLG